MEKLITTLVKESIEVKQKLLKDKEFLQQIGNVVTLICSAFKNGRKVIFFGNGGSAADAQHLAGEFIGRFKIERGALPALALHANSSVITALANDYTYGIVFARQIEAYADKGDVVVGISTSGNSENVLKGIKAARQKGCGTIGLLGGDGGIIKPICDVSLVVPSNNTPRIQEVHILIGHIICELVERELFGEM